MRASLSDYKEVRGILRCYYICIQVLESETNLDACYVVNLVFRVVLRLVEFAPFFIMYISCIFSNAQLVVPL